MKCNGVLTSGQQETSPALREPDANSTKNQTDLVTSIHHRTIPVRKKHHRRADGSIESTNYGGHKVFSACVEHRVETFEDLVKALKADENSPNSGLIRARYNTEDLGSARLARRFYRRWDSECVFHHGARMHRWQVFDVDELCIPKEIEGNHKAILQYTIAQLPKELHGADFFYQWSASMGVKTDVVKVHLYTLLDTFVDDSHIQNWISQHNEQYRQKHADRLTNPTEDLIDISLWRPTQLLTTSPPEFVGMSDPLKKKGIERSGVLRGAQGSVDLAPAIERLQTKLQEIKDREARERDKKRATTYSNDYTASENYKWAEKVRDKALENMRMLNGGSRTDVICINAKTIGGLVGAGYLDYQYELDQLVDVARSINPKKANNSASQAKSYFKRGHASPLYRESKPVQRYFPPKTQPKKPQPKPLVEPEHFSAHPPCTIEEISRPQQATQAAPRKVEELDLVDIFQRNYDDAKRVLHGFGRFTLANQCGTGKNTAITNVLVDHPELLDGMLIAEPTCVKRDEMAREMRAAGLPVRGAVTRTSKNCRRLDDIMLAGQKSPQGASQLCLACEFNPKGPNYTGEKCTYMTEKNRGAGAQIVTHAQLSGILAEEETTKPAILIIDEATSNEHGHERISMEQITTARGTGDIEMSQGLFNMLRIMFAESKKPHPKTGRPTTIEGLEICRRLLHLKEDRPAVKGTWDTAQNALDDLLEDGVPKSLDLLAKLCNVPNWRAILGLQHIQNRGWRGANIHNGQLSVPWVDALNTDAIACVVRTDATSTENVHGALGGTKGEWNRVNVKKPEHFEMIRIDESMSKSSGKDGVFSERKLKVWDAAHIENDGPDTLHIVHKAYFDEEHAMYKRVKDLQGPVIYYGGDEARGSNKYKHVTHVVADSWHVPKRAIEELAYRLEYLAETNGMENWKEVDWHEEAMFQMLPAEIIQTIQRARLVQASEKREIVVTLLDNRTLENSSPLFKDCVVEKPCWYTWLQTGEIIHGGRWTAERLLEALLETNNGVLSPTLFFEHPDIFQRVDDSVKITSTENPTKLLGFNDTAVSLSGDDAKRWRTSKNASLNGAIEWDESSKKGAENRKGQPNRFSPYIDLGDFSICLTNADYDGIRRVMAGEWTSQYGFWTKSALSSGRGQYALLHTRPITRDDIRRVVESAGVGWKVATCQGVRVRMDNWGARVIEAAKSLPHNLQQATRTVFADHLAKSMGESVSTLKRNLKAVSIDLAALHTLVPDPPPEPPKPRRKRTWKRPSMSSPHVQSIEKASQSWDIAALRAKAMEFRTLLRNSQGEARIIAADELWMVVFLGKISRGGESFEAMNEADEFVGRELGRIRMAA